MTFEIPIGDLIPTKIPGYADNADIQAALRLYHYGSYTYNPSNTTPSNLVSPSIAKTIYDIQQSIAAVSAGYIQTSIFTAKGQILSATASNVPAVLPLGSNNQFLAVNTLTATGLNWTNSLVSPSISAPTVSGAITLSGSTSGSTLIQPSAIASGTITFPAVTGTVVTTGDTATVTNAMLAGSIANNKLSNSSITINGSSVSLGGSITVGNLPITTTINTNTATTVDTVALSSFTTMEYTLSIIQDTKVRSSRIIVQQNGSLVDFAEYGIISTGDVISGILVDVSKSGSNSVLQVTITDAATTNATVKVLKTTI